MPGRLPVLLALLAVSAFLFPDRLPAQGAAPDSIKVSAQDTSAVESLDSVEQIIPQQSGPAESGSPALRGLGHLHPILIHFPIAWLVLTALYELTVALGGWKRSRGAPLWLLGLTLAGFLPALGSGLANAAGQVGVDAATAELIEDHRSLMFVSAGLLTAALVLGLLQRSRAGRGLKVLRLLLVMAAAVCVGIGAHMGGELVYGESYFPF
ncbi:hypothetical protein LLH00_03585 [bacterium]|nr:hypothetical protein [bacterium]